MNIFIEGIPGSGKSTLLRLLSERLPGYHAYYEGDLSPVELAWCSYMTPEQYQQELLRWSYVADEIRRNTMEEQGHFITSYTRVLAEDPAFYQHMEEYEIYNGRVSYDRFREIVYERYAAYRGDGALFDCSFFQNVIESLILFYEMSDDEIADFYRGLFAVVQQPSFLMIYLQNEDVEAAIDHIRKERVDEQGREIWYELVEKYYRTSPYGQRESAPPLIEYYKKRIALEKRILKEVLEGHSMIIPAKAYDIEKLVVEIQTRKV